MDLISESQELLWGEYQILDWLNIEPTNVRRRSDRLYDVAFNYESRTVLDASIGGKTVSVRTFENGKWTDEPSFTMPPAGTVQKCKASAWMPLLVISMVRNKEFNAVERMFYGNRLPPYAGDWSFIRDADPDSIWDLFNDVVLKFFSTNQQTISGPLVRRFAQVKG